MKEYDKYLTEIWGIGRKNSLRSQLMRDTMQWFKENLEVDKFKPHIEHGTERDGFKGTSQSNHSSFVLQPNKDGSEIKIIVNDDFYSVDIKSIQELEDLANDPDMRHFSKI